MQQQGETALYEDVLNFVGAASIGMKRATDELGVHRSQQRKAASLAPEVLTQLLDAQLLAPHQKEAGAAMLAEHAGTLSLLKKAVDRLTALEAERREKKAASEPGRADGEAGGSPAYDSRTDPYAGRRTSQKKASDEAILRVLD